MSCSHDSLPRDGNGIVQGAYRLLHEDPTFHGDIGVFTLREGQSTSPASGRALLCAIGEYGSRLYLEPWGDLPDGFALPELIGAEVSAETEASLERCPWRIRPRDVTDEDPIVEAAKPEPTKSEKKAKAAKPEPA